MRHRILGALVLLLFSLPFSSRPCTGQQSSSIRVTVTDAHGAALSDAEVHVGEVPSLVGLPAPNGTFTFKGVPPGNYHVSATYAGFRNKLVANVVVADGTTTELTVKLEPGPPKASDFRVHQTILATPMYSKALKEIGQPPLCPDSISESTEWYRFIWVPTFSQPVFFRVDIAQDGTATLLTHIWKGQGGYEWGKATRSLRRLTPEEEWDLFATLADVGFWTLPSQVDDPPNIVRLDGTDSLIEAVKDGKCHVVTRYSSPLTSLFAREFLAKVAKIEPYYKRGQ